MYNTTTTTYTVTDIRKTFENLEADIRTIARRTGKWEMSYVDNLFHDILILAENRYLESVDIILINSITEKPVRATKFVVNENGTASSSERAGQNNDWVNIPYTYLSVVLSYSQKWHNLSGNEKITFRNQNNFKIGWSASSIDTSFPNLTSSQAQMYANKGYELQKKNYK